MADRDDHLDPAAVAQRDHRSPGRIARRMIENRVGTAAGLADHPELLTTLVGIQMALDAMNQRNMVAETRHPVQWSGTVVLDSQGQAERLVQASSKSIFVANYSTAQVVVAAQSRQNAAPGAGPGVHVVPSGCAMTLNGLTTVWSFYGLAGGILGVQILGRFLSPSASVVNVDGGPI